MVNTLMTMLTYKRPAWSVTEQEFVMRFLLPLGVKPDEFGNLWLTVGKDPRTLWAAHTDTMHLRPGRQTVRMEKDGIVSLDPAKSSSASRASTRSSCASPRRTWSSWGSTRTP